MHAGTRPGPSRPRLARALLGLAGAIAGLATLFAAPADGQEGGRYVDVVQVSGWIDPIVVDFLVDALAAPDPDTTEAVVIQLDSPGALVDDARVERVVAAIEGSDVPVAVWVGSAGAHALREATRLVEAADVAGMSPGARVEVGGRRLTPDQALAAGVVDIGEDEAPVIGQFIAALDGDEVDGRTLRTAEVEQQEDGPETTLVVRARFAKLDLGPRLLHGVGSPPIAYLLLTAGLALVVFELFTIGIGIAAVVGAVSLALAGYGLDVLPTNPWGLALLVVGTFGFAVDVQTGAPRVWTGIGVVAYVAGSLLLFDDPVSLGWLPLVGGVLGMVLMMLAGLPATVRSRFSTPTVGRESMVGERGEAVVELKPEGVVRVRGALWPARTNRATPLAEGAAVEVVGIDGARLEVAPPAN